VYKKFASYEEAVRFSLVGHMNEVPSELTREPEIPKAQPGLQQPSQETTIRVNLTSETEIIAYTDGSLKDVAGCGIFWGDSHKLNASFVLPIPPHTSQRAELYAVIRAFELYEAHWPKDLKRLHIYTDSNYCMNIMNNLRRPGFRESNWKFKSGKRALNPDLVELLYCLVAKYPTAVVEKVKAHSVCYGNNAADILAGLASQKFC
jgi:ribonuclease HI